MAYRNRTIPDSDKGIRRFMYNFSRIIAQDPAKFDFDQSDADLLVNMADRFIAASVIAGRPSTRTSPAVRHKNDEKALALSYFRQYVAEVKANTSLSVQDKVDLGVVVEKNRRKSPLPPPKLPPTLFVRAAMNGAHEIGYWDTLAMTRRGKPRGATHLVLLCHVGDRPCADPAQARYVGAFTKYPIRVPHDPMLAGRTATYFAAWLTASGEQTRWSPGVSMTIVHVGMMMGQQAQRSGNGEVKLAA